MKILERLRKHRSHNPTRNDEFSRYPITVDLSKTGAIPGDYYYRHKQQEWCLSATIAINFWSNKEQFDESIKIAERALIARLFGDIFCEIAEMRLAISNGDRLEANRVCDRIEKKLTDGGKDD